MSNETLNSYNSFEKYKKIIKIFKIISKILGIDRALDISEVNFKFKICHIFDYFFVVHYVISVIYIISTKFENKLDVLRPLTLCPITIQCIVKLTTFFSNVNLIKELNEFNLRLHDNTKGTWQKLLYLWLQRFEKVSTFHIGVHWVSATFLLCYPLYGYILFDEKMPFFDVVIPFVDVTSTRGYFISLAFQFVLCLFVISIMYSVDYVFILTTFSGAAIIDLVVEDCNALTVAIKNSAEEKDVEDLLVVAVRRNQIMRWYVNTVCVIFEKGSLIQLYCAGFTLCVCLFVAKISEWFAVYFVALGSLYQLSLYCLMGTMIEWKSDQLAMAVYDVPWYNLGIRQKKLFRYFLQMSQSTLKITLMGTLSLNVETGMAILKSVYSLYILIDRMY